MPNANCFIITKTYRISARIPRQVRGKSFRGVEQRCKSFRIEVYEDDSEKHFRITMRAIRGMTQSICHRLAGE